MCLLFFVAKPCSIAVFLAVVVAIASSVRFTEKDETMEVCDPPVGGFPAFLTMEPKQAMCYAKTKCGLQWPSQCSDHNSIQTRVTDGWICNSDRKGKNEIADMSVYKLAHNFRGITTDMGPRCPSGYQCSGNPGRCVSSNGNGSTMEGECSTSFDITARCVKGKCVDAANKYFKGRGSRRKYITTKKISTIGAQICKLGIGDEGVKTTIQVEVQNETSGETVTRDVEVEVDLDTCSSRKAADYKVQLKIPLEALQFNADETTFANPTVAKQAIKDTLNQLGVVETARNAKVCGHGFTNASAADAPNIVELMNGRARVISEEARKIIPDTTITESDGVAHPVRVQKPLGGLVIFLNGCAKEPCYEESDDHRGWKGAPLL